MHIDRHCTTVDRLRAGVLMLAVSAGLSVVGHTAENVAAVTRVCVASPAAGPISLDGRLDEPSWAGAMEVSGFTVSGKEDLAPQQMSMRLLYDATNLYLGVVCLEPAMQALHAAVRQRDGAFWEDDSVEFFIDPGHTHEDFFQFAIAAGGAAYDNRSGNALWNSGWQAVVQRGADRWAVEGALPLADLPGPRPAPGTLWGFNLCRERHAGGKLELHNWADVQRVFNSCNRFGHLAFVGPQWTPSVTSIAELARQAGGPSTLVFVGDGFWTASAAAPPLFTGYVADVAAHVGDMPGRLAEVAGLLTDGTPPAQRQCLAELQKSLAAVEGLIAPHTALRAAAWADALGTLGGLRGAVETLYWQVKLADLNRTMP